MHELVVRNQLNASGNWEMLGGTGGEEVSTQLLRQTHHSAMHVDCTSSLEYFADTTKW